MRKSVLAIIILAHSSLAQAQETTTNDSTVMMNGTLEEVTVKASNVIRKVDRQVILPTREQKKKAVNGLELTQRLSLPRIFVDSSKGNIGMAGGETLQLRINGVEATSQDVLALSPQDIKRVEFHDTPGLRYGDGVGAVIDYITIRRTSGGNIGVSLLQETNSVGADQVYGNFHNGKSQFNFSYYTNFHSYDDTYTDKQATFSFPDGAQLHQNTEGRPGKNSEILHLGSATYNYTSDDDFMLSTKFSLLKYDISHAATRGEVYNTGNPGYRILRETDDPRWWNRPSLDIYLYKKMKNAQSIALDIVGTYNGNHQKSFFKDSKDGTVFTDIFTDVHSKRYSLIAEASYEKAWGGNRLTAGLKHTQGKTDNTYRGDADYNTHMRDADTYAYAEFMGKADKLTYTLGIGTAHTHIRQQGSNALNQWYFRPTLKLLYAFNNAYSLRFRYLLRNANPSLSQLSDVEQQTDSLQLLTGNPLLDANLQHTFGLDLDVNKANCKLGLSLKYILEKRPVMEETNYNSNRLLFVKTYNNQRRFETLNANLYANIDLFKEHVNIYFSGGVNHFISTGNAYRHRFTNFYYISQVQADYKNMFFTALFIRQNYLFYGEQMNSWNQYNQYTLGYKFRNNMRLSVGIMNPFGEFDHGTKESYAAAARWKEQTYYPNLKQCLLATFSWNLNFGKQYKALQRKLENSDSENGILKN
ncbi:outer membrane beta-barrel protein [Phocaeicola sp.]